MKSFKINGKNYYFLGTFNNKKEVPALAGIYIIKKNNKYEIFLKKYKDEFDSSLYRKGLYINRSSLEDKISDNKKFNIKILPKDDILMVIAKELLNTKREKELKEKIPYNKYVNIFRQLVGGGSLSFKRFQMILDALDVDLEILLYDRKKLNKKDKRN